MAFSSASMMLGQVRPGVDHRDFALADQVRLRAGVGERRWIVREHARDPGLELLKRCVRRVHGCGLCHERPWLG